MKFTAENNAQLSKILATCHVGGIESVIIEDGMVRGIADNNFFIFSPTELKLSHKMGLSRLSALRNRYDLFTSAVTNHGPVTIEAKESERGEISALQITSGRSKTQFRCTSTSLIRAPKQVNDAPTHRVLITAKELLIILNAIKVMGNKRDLQLIIRKDRTAEFNITDDANDAFTLSLENPVELKAGADSDSVVHTYLAETFHSVMRTVPEGTVLVGPDIGALGTIFFQVNGLSVAIMPKIDENAQDEE